MSEEKGKESGKTKTPRWIWFLLALVVTALFIADRILVANAREQKHAAQQEFANELKEFAEGSQGSRSVPSTQQTGGTVRLAYDSFTDLSIEPDRLYIIVFGKPGTTGWIDFHSGTLFTIQPMKGHTTIFDDGRKPVYDDGGADVKLGKVDKIKLQSDVPDNIVWISTWRKN